MKFWFKIIFYKCLNDYSYAQTECSTKIRSQINNSIPTLVGPHLASSNLANACTNNPPCPCFPYKYSESNDLDVAGLFDYFDIIIWRRLWTSFCDLFIWDTITNNLKWRDVIIMTNNPSDLSWQCRTHNTWYKYSLITHNICYDLAPRITF